MSSDCNDDQNPETIPPAGNANFIRVPARGVGDFRALLANPVKHWRPGYSAYELAHSWWDADQFHCGFPPRVRAVLDSTEDPLLDPLPLFRHLRPLMMFPEHPTKLPAKGNCSQTDLWVLATPPFAPFTHSDDDFVEDNADWAKIDPKIGFARIGPRELVSIAVEGKVKEDFGPLMSDWRRNANDNRLLRLRFLCYRLGLDVDTLPGSIRYQLIHRTAAALIEAERFCAKHALMLVHSFDPNDSGFGDYQAFVALLGGQAAVDQVVTIGERSGIKLSLAWVRDTPRSRVPDSEIPRQTSLEHSIPATQIPDTGNTATRPSEMPRIFDGTLEICNRWHVDCLLGTSSGDALLQRLLVRLSHFLNGACVGNWD